MAAETARFGQCWSCLQGYAWNSSFHPRWRLHNQTSPYSWKERLSFSWFNIVKEVCCHHVSAEEAQGGSKKLGVRSLGNSGFLIQHTMSSKHYVYMGVTCILHDLNFRCPHRPRTSVTQLCRCCRSSLRREGTACHVHKYPQTVCPGTNTKKQFILLHPQAKFKSGSETNGPF